MKFLTHTDAETGLKKKKKRSKLKKGATDVCVWAEMTTSLVHYRQEDVTKEIS